MADATTVAASPGPGHNQGPLDLSLILNADQLLADLQADTTALFARTEELVAAFARFQDATKDGITSDDMLARAGDFSRQMSAHLTTIDARRVAIKKPVLDAQRTIDGFFKRDLSDPVDAAKTAVGRKADAYVREKQRQEAAAAAAAAARQRAEAQRLAEEAERQQSSRLMDAAVEAEAQAAAVEAAPPAPVQVRSDYGTTVGTRRGPWKVRVTDITKVPPQYLAVNEPVLLATARTDPRIDAGEQPVPGVEFYREIKASIR